MKNKGFFSGDFLVPIFGLLFSIILIGSIYRIHVWPTAEDIEIASRVEASQNPDKPLVADRSLVMILKDNEQMLCIMLMLWAMIIIAYKFTQLFGEHNAMSASTLNISKGERILPEEVRSHYKELEGRINRSPSLQHKILPKVVTAALQRFDATGSIQDAAHAAQARADTAYSQLESDLSLLRYIAWAIPSVGFIGTVRGIGEALALADQAIRGNIKGVTEALGLAFNSTLVALLLSIVLMYFVHLLQSKQEQLLVDIEERVSKDIIGQMLTPESEEVTPSFT